MPNNTFFQVEVLKKKGIKPKAEFTTNRCKLKKLLKGNLRKKISKMTGKKEIISKANILC